jgi:TolA-binding protein
MNNVPKPNGEAGGEGSGNTIQDWNEMECRLTYMQSQVEEAQSTLARKVREQELIEKRAERAEAEKAETLAQLEVANKEVRATAPPRARQKITAARIAPKQNHTHAARVSRARRKVHPPTRALSMLVCARVPVAVGAPSRRVCQADG